MKLVLLLHAFLCFFFSFLLHLLIWRMRRVKKEILWLIFLFLFFSPMTLFSLRLIGYYDSLEFYSVLLVYAALAAAYLQTYPVLKADIPTFRVLFLVDSAGHAGITEEEVCEQMFGRSDLYVDKLKELQNDAFVIRKNGELALTLLGRGITAIFMAYRALLGLEKGSG